MRSYDAVCLIGRRWGQRLRAAAFQQHAFWRLTPELRLSRAEVEAIVREEVDVYVRAALSGPAARRRAPCRERA